MLVSQLIARAYYLSGVVSRDLETVSGAQTEDGLLLLNEFIGSLAADGKFIPFDMHVDVAVTPGVDEYVLTDIVELDDVRYKLVTGAVLYPMIRATKRAYWGDMKQINVTSMPFYYYFERVKQGGKIYLYYKPNNQVESLQVTGRYSLTSLTLTTDLTATVAGLYYQNWLRHELAQYICNDYEQDLKESTRQEMMRLRSQIILMTPYDTTYSYVLLSNRNTDVINYSQMQWGGAYRPC